MRVCIIDAHNNRKYLEVPNNITIEELKKRCHITNINFSDIEFASNGNLLENGDSLDRYLFWDKEVYYINFFGLFDLDEGKHKCPYGCGRMIPDNYKGCSELLRDYPDFFK